MADQSDKCSRPVHAVGGAVPLAFVDPDDPSAAEHAGEVRRNVSGR
jgi:hypothetical protein